MEAVLGFMNGIAGERYRKDDDFSDRFSNKYTVIMLLIFATLISVQINMGDPINCWAPVHFTGSHERYANSYCWVNNTYYIPFEDDIPKQHIERQHVIKYYQWIPFILLFQAVMFYFPSVVWHGLNVKGGMDADNILNVAHSFSKADKLQEKEETLVLLSNQMHRFLWSRRDYGYGKKGISWLITSVFSLCGRRFGSYLISLFMASKLLYMLNIFVQFYMLGEILGIKYYYYGIQVMSNMVADHDWTKSSLIAFPRVTLCDFQVRRLGNVHRYTLQCALRINLYNEKLFMFMWFWLMVVALVTFLGIFVWLTRFTCRPDRLKFVKNHLCQMAKVQSDNLKDEMLCEDFLDKYLKQDGVFLLRLIAHNTNHIAVTEIMCSLWDKWRSVAHPLRASKRPSAPSESDEDDVIMRPPRYPNSIDAPDAQEMQLLKKQ